MHKLASKTVASEEAQAAETLAKLVAGGRVMGGKPPPWGQEVWNKGSKEERKTGSR